MSQHSEIEKVKARIKALAAKTIDNGCTEQEAMLAMEKVGELLRIFNLSMAECLSFEKANVNFITDSYVFNSKNHPSWDSALVHIGKFCDCRVWVNYNYSFGKKVSSQVNFFGMEPDVEMAKYLVDVIAKAHETELAKFKTTEEYVNYPYHRRRITTDFSKGFASGVGDKLTVLKRKNDLENQKHVTGTSLVLVKMEHVNREFGKTGMRLRTRTRTQGINSRSGYNQGKSAGSRINVNRPVGNNGGIAGYL